jgi:hypothetical protein
LDDTSHRQTEWVFEYALGNNPTAFTPIATTPAQLLTGGDIWSNTAVTGSIPAAINNSNVPVYLRLRSASAAQPVPPNMGGNRATTAIDNFKLNWTGNATGVEDVVNSKTTLTVIGMPTTNKIVLGCTFNENGRYNVSVFDLAGKKVYSRNAAVNTAGAQVITIEDINLVPGMYVVKMNDSKSASAVKVNIQ